MPVSFGTNEYLPAYVQTDITYTSLALAVLGWYLVTINQLSFYLKSKLFMSNALIALCIGIGTLASQNPFGALVQIPDFHTFRSCRSDRT